MKVITTNRLNRFWKNGILPKIAEKLASSAVINNLTTNIAGYALDARQGKVLKDEIDKTNTSLSTLNADLSDNHALQTLTDLTKIGCNNNSYITEVINAMPYPASELSFWVNEGYPNIFNELKTSTGTTNVYGIYTIRRISNVWILRLDPYNRTELYERKYTTSNALGWVNGGAWVKR